MNQLRNSLYICLYIITLMQDNWDKINEEDHNDIALNLVACEVVQDLTN